MEKNCGLIGGICAKIACSRAVYQPRMLKEVFNECNGPEVLYKNNLISNIMNFNENQRNFREKTMKK